MISSHGKIELQPRNTTAFRIITGARRGTVKARVEVAAHERLVVWQSRQRHSREKVTAATADDYGGKEKDLF